MNPFKHAQTDSGSSLDGQFAGRLTLIVSLLAFVAGMGTVGWWTYRKGQRARADARLEAQVRIHAVDRQLSQVLEAVQTLAALTRQSGGTVPNFQRLGSDLLAVWPSLAWLDVEPGGVVADIVPRVGHDRSLGLNALKDPAQQAGAQEAAQRRVPIVSAPVVLEGGEWGLVARAPVILRGRDGRDFCSGYVAAALRLKDLRASVKLDPLASKGYDCSFYLWNSLQRKPLVLDARGSGSLAAPERQSVRWANADFCLALQPRGGWVNKTQAGLACVAVFVASGLMWLGLHLLETGREMERSLGETNRLLARATADRKQGREALAGAETELKQARALLQQSESVAADLQARVDAAARGAHQSHEALQVKLNEAEAGARDLQTRLEGAARVFKTKQTELDETHAALQAAQNNLRELQARSEAGAAAQARVREQDATLADLRARLDAATSSARDAAEEIAAGVARLEQLEDRNRKLKARLVEAEAAELKLAETSALLDTARAEVVRLSVAQSTAETPPQSAEPAPPEASPPVPTPETPVVLEEAPAPVAEPLAPPAEPIAAEAQGPTAPSDPAVEASAAAALAPEPPAEESAKRKPAKADRPKKARRDDQLDFFAAPAVVEAAVEVGGDAVSFGPAFEAPESTANETPAEATAEKASRAPRGAPPANPAQLRKAINQILPLFAGQDPGARDCLKDNRAIFRSAFAPETYPDFEQAVNAGDFTAAMDHLKKAARKHGISI